MILLLGVGVVMELIVVGIGGAVAVMIYSAKVKRRGKRGQGVHLLWRRGMVLDPALGKFCARPAQVDMYR